jgi:hypothetical protein
MPVVAPTRYKLRGRIRAQVTYARQINQRLVNADIKNPALGIFNGVTGPGSRGDMIIQISQLENALLARS